MQRPSLTVIGGPNGSGKTSVITVLQDSGHHFATYLNADDIAATMGGPDAARAAQTQVREFRDRCIAERQSVSYETVLSHPSHLDAMERAVALGFYVRLIFVTTDDPEINIARVAQRVAKGGHPVPDDRVISRYRRCMTESLPRAVRIADEAMVWDNSFAAPRGRLPVAHVTGRYVRRYPTPTLDWPERYLFAPLRAEGYTLADI